MWRCWKCQGAGQKRLQPIVVQLPPFTAKVASFLRQMRGTLSLAEDQRTAMRIIPLGLVSSCVLMLSAPATLGQAGDLDPAFGTGGVATHPQIPTCVAVTLQPDGKIVSVGSGSLSRFLSNGELDSTFGSGGIVTVAPTGIYASLADVVVQANGDIVCIGQSSAPGYRLFAFRVHSDGSNDTGFGINGYAAADIDSISLVAEAMAIEQSGNIIAFGWEDSWGNRPLAVRFDTQGVLDLTFGVLGVVHPFVGTQHHWNAMALYPDGDILATGGISGPSDLPLLKIRSDGSFDPAFGNNGMIFTDVFGYEDQGACILVDDLGRILVGGRTRNGDTTSYAIVRHLSNGSLDASFGNNGVAVASFGNPNNAIYDMAFLSDGRIVAGGFSLYDGELDLSLARFTSDGLVDSTFGINGFVLTDLNPASSAAADLAVQPDGRIVTGVYGLPHSLHRYLTSPDVSIAEMPTSARAQVSPNPTNNMLTLTVGSAIDIMGLRVVDATGKQVPTVAVISSNHDELMMDVSGLVVGMYTLRVQTKSGMASVRFVKY